VLLPELVLSWKQYTRLRRGFIGSESQLRVMGITLPDGVIMKTAGTILMNAWAALIVAVLVLGPLVLMHGYRQWWVVIFYAVGFAGTIGGIFANYYMAGRNMERSPGHEPV
jgi:Na+/H+-dicarboxylate symporter